MQDSRLLVDGTASSDNLHPASLLEHGHLQYDVVWIF
jgi:hypothetical protein